MDVTTASTRPADDARAVSASSGGVARLIVYVASTAFMGVVTVAPAPVAFALTLAAAAAWCFWLEVAAP
jgi:hypothetical protein